MKISRPSCLFPALLLLAAWSPSLRALDFTLHRQQTSSDAISVSNTYITDGQSKIFLRIPNSWKVSDSAQALDCLPDHAECRVRIEQLGGVKVLPLDGPGREELRRRAAGLLPVGAKDVTTLPERADLLPIFGWTTLEITNRYEYFGRVMCRSILFINMLPGRVLQVSVTAPEASFDAVHEQMRLIMSSWFEPSHDLPPDLARKLEEGTVGGS